MFFCRRRTYMTCTNREEYTIDIHSTRWPTRLRNAAVCGLAGFFMCSQLCSKLQSSSAGGCAAIDGTKPWNGYIFGWLAALGGFLEYPYLVFLAEAGLFWMLCSLHTATMRTACCSDGLHASDVLRILRSATSCVCSLEYGGGSFSSLAPDSVLPMLPALEFRRHGQQARQDGVFFSVLPFRNSLLGGSLLSPAKAFFCSLWKDVARISGTSANSKSAQHVQPEFGNDEWFFEKF